MANIIRIGGSGTVLYSLTTVIPSTVSDFKVTRTVSGVGNDDLLGEISENDPIFRGDVLLTSARPNALYGVGVEGIEYTVSGDTTVTVQTGGVGYPAIAEATWEEINAIAVGIADGDFTLSISEETGYRVIDEVGWSVGDEIPYADEYGNENAFLILDFGRMSAGITFRLKYLSDVPMIIGGYIGSMYLWSETVYLKPYLDDAYYLSIPHEIRKYIKESVMYQTSTSGSNANYALLSYISIIARTDLIDDEVYMPDYEKLNYYEVNDDLIMRTADGVAREYWTRTKYYPTSATYKAIYYYVSESGIVGSTNNEVEKYYAPIFSL